VNAFVDSNVVVYAHDRMDHVKRERERERERARKRKRKRALLEVLAPDGSLTLCTQVLQEECHDALIRKVVVEPAKALFAAETLAAARVAGTNADFVPGALRLSQRLRLSVRDGLIVQAALAARCTTLFTEDLQAGQRFGELEVVNPFTDAAREARAAYVAKPVARRERLR
jgi:predicted nucleic acid-binding protein